MDMIQFISSNYGVRFEFKLYSSSYDLSNVSELFPDLMLQIVDYLDGYRKSENDDN